MVRVTPPIVSATLEPASAVPVTALVCSLALMMSLPATTEITGALGTSVSTVMARLAAAEVLPAASVALTDRVSGPCPMSVMSAACSV